MCSTLTTPSVIVVKSNDCRRGDTYDDAITVKNQDQERQVDAASLASQKSIRKYDVFTLLFLPFITKDDRYSSVVVVKTVFIQLSCTLNQKYQLKVINFSSACNVSNLLCYDPY